MSSEENDQAQVFSDSMSAKKSPRKAQGPRGARTPFLFRERLAGASHATNSLYFEANDGFLAERAPRGPQDPKIPDADSSRGLFYLAK